MTKKQNEMFVIKEMETGRFVDLLSFPKTEKGEPMFVTSTGKLYTTFCTFKESAEELLEAVSKLNTIGKKLYIDIVNPDTLPLGNLHFEKVHCMA